LIRSIPLWGTFYTDNPGSPILRIGIPVEVAADAEIFPIRRPPVLGDDLFPVAGIKAEPVFYSIDNLRGKVKR
jgi:hypothetical protein